MKREIPSNQHITYQLQFRKCGKKSCSTCRNSQGHGPYWYAYWREGSRLYSGYVGKNNPKKPSTTSTANPEQTANIPISQIVEDIPVAVASV